MKSNKALFKKSSTTYYYSALFFPKRIREDVTTLYAFLRKADNFVDKKPQDIKGFKNFVKDYKKSKQELTNNNILDDFQKLVKKVGIKDSWVESFLASMESDIHKRDYKTISETKKYMYGSAEVIGLMLSTIMSLERKSYKYAKLLGRYMQYTNFIRDVDEDNSLGRNYLPSGKLKTLGIKGLKPKDIKGKEKKFEEYINNQVDLASKWYKEAKNGFKYIPFRLRVPIVVASEMYNWTLKEIKKDPHTIYLRKIKPTKWRVIRTFFRVFLSESIKII